MGSLSDEYARCYADVVRFVDPVPQEGLRSRRSDWQIVIDQHASPPVWMPGDHAAYMEDVYAGIFRLFDKVLKRYGLSFSAVNAADDDVVEGSMTPQTRIVWYESPANPIL
jgi:Cys/Met metabolism PLP-dependent enzyme